MLIDWFTVIAQVVNFLILMWLMQRFLYHPILNAIDAREKKIAGELKDAAAKMAEADKERDAFLRKSEELNQQRSALMKTATQEAKTEHQRLLAEARQAADHLSAKRQQTLSKELHNLKQAINRRTQHEVFAIARKALTDLAGESLEARMVATFVARLGEMNEPSKAGLGKALSTATESALVRSAFELSAEQCAAIQQALNETFSAEIKVRFKAAPEQVGGIEMFANGQKVGWSISDYLVSLEQGIGDLLKDKTQPESKP